MVDVVGRLGVEVSDRVVADRGEMDTASKPTRSSLSTSRTSARTDSTPGGGRPERAGGEEVGVEADDLVAARSSMGTRTEPM